MRVSTEAPRVATKLLAALAVGLVFRLLVVAFFPFDAAGDSALYERLARGLLDHGTFGLEVGGRLEPVNVRMPGYPAFLAATEALLGPGRTRVRVAQAFLDTATCALAGLAAALLAAPPRRRRALVAGTWLAALCPFTANYAAAVLAEVPGAFWTAASFVALAFGVRRAQERRFDRRAAAALVAAGLAAGAGCYFRPETPILLAAPAIVLAIAWRRPRDWPRLLATGAALGLGLAMALVPWGIRNVRALGRFEVLSPPGANMPGEVTGEGFDRWAATWLTANDEIYEYWFKLESEPIEAGALPPSAIDTPEERKQVAALFARHNATLTMTAEWDDAFARLARERTARHPLRTWVRVPLGRALALWTTPRIELLPFSGNVFPLGPSWEDDPVDLSATVVLFFVGLLYPALAVVGGVRTEWRTGAAMVGVYLVLRTALMTHVPGPEPRYLVVAFPLLCALGAQLWAEEAAGARP